jgi:hypothetical protein
MCIPAVLADGLWSDFYRGLEVLSTPSGGPLQPLGDGSRVNGQRLGRLRIVPNQPGRGWDLELDRSFGTDSRGRPETLDLGPLELTLDGQTQTTAGFTRRGFLTGNLNSVVNGLDYTLAGKTGAQDVLVTGTLDAQTNLEINQFGFYNLTLAVANTNSTTTVDGVIANDSEVSDFNIGPINVQGNIFVDAFVGLLGTLGADTSGLAALSPSSPIDRLNEAIQEQLRATELVAGATFGAAQIGPRTQDGLLLGQAAYGPPAPSFNPSLSPADAVSAHGAGLAPEPSTMILLALGAGLMAVRRRR